MDLTDIQWQRIKEFIPDDPVRTDRRGRPWKEQRTALDGILWILRTGAPWKDLPDRYGAYQTVHRRFQNWCKAGVLRAVLEGRRGRTRPRFNDGRTLRRYRKRWKIERLFAWLHNFTHLVVRWEYHAENFLGFLHLGCALILLRHL